MRINNLAPEGVDLFVKQEAFNLLGSVKDRIALGIIETAERNGILRLGQTVIEATSGKTGISLALVCAQKGYPLVIVMAESFSLERRKLLRFMGARVVLTLAADKGSGMLAKAVELAREHGWFLCRQFDNPANSDTHALTTAEEILADFGPGGLDYWVSGVGTGGTVKGVASVLKACSPATRIIGCEPKNAHLLASALTQAMRPDGVPAASHRVFAPHPMQGRRPDFIPQLAADALSEGLIDEIEPIAGKDAILWSRRLAADEGIFCGTSGGATFAGAIVVAHRVPKGSRILAMLPDTGERYLSTPPFADISEEMSADEHAISVSTPGHRFNGAARVAITPPQREVPAKDVEALNSLVIDPAAPVVMLGLEWCEFSWSVPRFLTGAGIPFRTIDLDGRDCRADRKGQKLRWTLRQMVGFATLPQVFLNGCQFGGATETLAAFEAGEVADSRAARVAKSAMSYLPKWVHPQRPAA